jgi:hypothetical protein
MKKILKIKLKSTVKKSIPNHISLLAKYEEIQFAWDKTHFMSTQLELLEIAGMSLKPLQKFTKAELHKN